LSPKFEKEKVGCGFEGDQNTASDRHDLARFKRPHKIGGSVKEKERKKERESVRERE
jgi:hypothetical protein